MSGLESVATSKLIEELIVRVDSIAGGITMAGQDEPMSVEALSVGWGEIVDSHLRAAAGQSQRKRVVVGRHLIANLVKLYLMNMSDSHRLAGYKNVLGDMFDAFAFHVKKEDVEATEQERVVSEQKIQRAVESMMRDILPIVLAMWSQNQERGVVDWLDYLGVDQRK